LEKKEEEEEEEEDAFLWLVIPPPYLDMLYENTASIPAIVDSFIQLFMA